MIILNRISFQIAFKEMERQEALVKEYKERLKMQEDAQFQTGILGAALGAATSAIGAAKAAYSPQQQAQRRLTIATRAARLLHLLFLSFPQRCFLLIRQND